MKVRTTLELEEKLDEDIAWRKREFTTLKFMLDNARGHEKLILMRASIALLYAHWEGHIKHCALVYLNYLNHLAPSYENMSDNFIQLSLGQKFSQGFSIKKFSSQKEIFDYLTQTQKSNFSIKEEVVINTESNLKYEVILNILDQLGLDSSLYQLKENFINSKLLKCRNAIAHGDRVNQQELEDTYSELEKELLIMITAFQNLIRNAVSTKGYLKSAS
jgi:hypothetical protein